jgi:mono/diheme cytochrome c family protein
MKIFPSPTRCFRAGIIASLGALLFSTTSMSPDRALAADTPTDSAHEIYLERCGVCHGANAEGGDHGPILHDPDFWAQWSGGSARKLYSRIISTMPADNPGSVPPADVAQIIAYLARLNSGTGIGAARDAEALDAVELAPFSE